MSNGMCATSSAPKKSQTCFNIYIVYTYNLILNFNKQEEVIKPNTFSTSLSTSQVKSSEFLPRDLSRFFRQESPREINFPESHAHQMASSAGNQTP